MAPSSSGRPGPVDTSESAFAAWRTLPGYAVTIEGGSVGEAPGDQP